MNHLIRDKTKQSDVIQEQIYTATKKASELLRLPWTSQGLNLGPPDYES
jgi:hypothetical protein